MLGYEYEHDLTNDSEGINIRLDETLNHFAVGDHVINGQMQAD